MLAGTERDAHPGPIVSLIAQTDCYCVASLGGIPKYLGMAVRILWTIFIVLLVLWLLGFSFHIAGRLIHPLPLWRRRIPIINLVSGRRGLL
jgi:hypothetical protein